MENTFYSWKTKKTSKGFEFSVDKITASTEIYENGRYAKTETVKTGIVSSRAKAKTRAQRYMRYYNSLEKVA